MLEIIKTNHSFFIAFLIFIIIGGVALFNIEQGEAILFFSDNRFSFGNYFFRFFTKLGEEPIYILLVTIFLFMRFRYAILIPIVGVVSLVTSFGLKMYFSHDRPFRFFTKNEYIDQINLVEGVDLYSGMTSFPSGHTMSAFAVCSFVAFLFSKKQNFGLLMFFCALLIGISRIYLVQHFLKDVYLGAILGVLVAMIVYWIQIKFPYNEAKWIDRSFSLETKPKDKA